jgi:hypothetical protein
LGTRHVVPDSGCTYETTEIMVTPTQVIVAWQKRLYNGKLNKNSQGPFYAEEIPEYTQQTLSMGLSKRGKHKYNKTTCDVNAYNMSKLSVAQDEMFGSIVRTADIHTIDKLVTRQHRLTDKSNGNHTETSISNNIIIVKTFMSFLICHGIFLSFISMVRFKKVLFIVIVLYI